MKNKPKKQKPKNITQEVEQKKTEESQAQANQNIQEEAKDNDKKSIKNNYPIQEEAKSSMSKNSKGSKQPISQESQQKAKEETKSNKTIPVKSEDKKSTNTKPIEEAKSNQSKRIEENKKETQSIKSENRLPTVEDATKYDPNKSNVVIPQGNYDKYNTQLEKKSEKSENRLPTVEDATKYDPNKPNVVIPQGNYDKYKVANDNQSVKSKNTQISTISGVSTDAVNPERVILPDNVNKEEVFNLLCFKCKLFPLAYETCSECKMIYCKACLRNMKKCHKCNSIYKTGPLIERLVKLYSVAKIKCLYLESGCQDNLLISELVNHEKQCKTTPIKCKYCWKDFNYGTIQIHWSACEKNTRRCDECGYEDMAVEFSKTEKKIEHSKHIIKQEIQEMIHIELDKFQVTIKEMIDAIPKEKKDNENPNAAIVVQMIALQEMIRNINDKATSKVSQSFAPNEPDKNLKNIELISTLVTDIDNSFECDKKFIVLSTYKQEYLVIYPTAQYGIQAFNLSNNSKGHLIPKAHESNITCMANTHNAKESLTYFASASFDRSIKIWCIENNWQLVVNIPEAHGDYSIFAIEMISDNDIVRTISGNYTNKEVKIWKIDGTCEAVIVCHNYVASIAYRNSNELYIGTTTEIEQYDGKTTLIRTLTANPPAKHTSMTFIDDLLIESDSLGKIRVWILSSGQLKNQIDRGILKHQINSVYAWDGRYVVCGTRDNRIMLYDIIDGLCVDELGSHDGYVYCVKIAEHWKYVKVIITSGFDGKIKLWGSKQ